LAAIQRLKQLDAPNLLLRGAVSRRQNGLRWLVDRGWIVGCALHYLALTFFILLLLARNFALTFLERVVGLGQEALLKMGCDREAYRVPAVSGPDEVPRLCGAAPVRSQALVLLPSNELEEKTMKALCWHGKNLMPSAAGM